MLESLNLSLREIIVFIHALSAGVGIGAVFTTDFLFFKFTKEDRRLSEKNAEIMKGLSRIIWIAITLLLASGIYLVATKMAVMQNPKFLLKMIVVAIVLLNGLLLNIFLTPRLHRIAFHDDVLAPTDSHDNVRKIAMASGAISAFSWATAFLLGKLNTIPFSLAIGAGIYFAILAIIALGANLTKRGK